VSRSTGINNTHIRQPACLNEGVLQDRDLPIDMESLSKDGSGITRGLKKIDNRGRGRLEVTCYPLFCVPISRGLRPE